MGVFRFVWSAGCCGIQNSKSASDKCPGNRLDQHREYLDLARHMGFSKPSISHAVSVLRDGGFLTVDENGFLHLTGAGREVAEKIYERHRFFMEWLMAIGVDEETAETDACRIEHAISDKSFRKLQEAYKEGEAGSEHL